MPCVHPIKAYRSRLGKNANGSWPIVFKPSEAYTDLEVMVPCGRCITCRLERSRQWAVRCMHEAQLHEYNCFITLTYADEFVPDGLKKRDLQLFFKRLRKSIDGKIRYYACGEYGEKLGRPHFHACIFGHDFPDKVFWQNRKGVDLYISESLSKIWPYGWHTIGDCTWESAAYVARYIVKKVLGKGADDHYNGLQPEFTVMSRRPGIGKMWIDKYYKDVYPDDSIIVRTNKRCKPPKYYDDVYDTVDQGSMQKVRARRIRESKKRPQNLEAKEKIKLAQVALLKREMENQ